MASSDDDYEWQPPTEAEMKVIQARRERSEKISKLMGDYLLKGYKMLSICCNECSTILLQDRDGRKYCVACNELDSDTGKDDPALSQEAARRQAAEERQRRVIQGDSSALSTLTPDMNPSSSIVTNGFCSTTPKENITVSQRSANPVAGHNPSVLHSVSADRAGAGTIQQPVTAPNQTYAAAVNTPVTPVVFGELRRSSSTPTNVAASKFDVAGSIAAVTGKLQWATQELPRTASVEGSIQLCHLIKSCAETLATLYSVHDNNNNGAMPQD